MRPSLVTLVSAVVSKEASLCSAFILDLTLFPCGCLRRKKDELPTVERDLDYGSAQWNVAPCCPQSTIQRPADRHLMVSHLSGFSSGAVLNAPFLKVNLNTVLKCSSVPGSWVVVLPIKC